MRSITDLSQREREALRLAADGLTTEEIAVRMAVCVSTVNTYFWRIYEKLGVRYPREQAILLYLRGYGHAIPE